MNTQILPIVPLLLLLGLPGCKQEISGELGDPIDKRSGFLGTWELATFTQQDLNNPLKETRDLSSVFIQDDIQPLTLTFNDDDSYTIVQTIGRDYFGDGGDWAFDDPEFPTFLRLFQEGDTLQYNLGTTVRPYDSQMTIEYRRSCGEGGALLETVIYAFTFNRIPNESFDSPAGWLGIGIPLRIVFSGGLCPSISHLCRGRMHALH